MVYVTKRQHSVIGGATCIITLIHRYCYYLITFLYSHSSYWELGALLRQLIAATGGFLDFTGFQDKALGVRVIVNRGDVEG